MNKIISIFLFFFISVTTLFAQDEIKWLNFNEAQKVAQSEDKIILVDIISDNCVFCRKMDKQTYTNKKIIKLVNQGFIPVKFNPGRDSRTYTVGDKTYTSMQLLAYLTQNSTLNPNPKVGFPTIVFYFPKTEKIYQETGFIEPPMFKYMLTNILKVKQRTEK